MQLLLGVILGSGLCGMLAFAVLASARAQLREAREEALAQQQAAEYWRRRYEEMLDGRAAEEELAA